MSPGRTGPTSRFGRSPLTGKMITTSKLKRHGTRHDWPQSRFADLAFPTPLPELAMDLP